MRYILVILGPVVVVAAVVVAGTTVIIILFPRALINNYYYSPIPKETIKNKIFEIMRKRTNMIIIIIFTIDSF